MAALFRSMLRRGSSKLKSLWIKFHQQQSPPKPAMTQSVSNSHSTSTDDSSHNPPFAQPPGITTMAASKGPAIAAGPATEPSATETNQSNKPNSNTVETAGPGSKRDTNGAAKSN